ncbi:DUF6339 family protein [Marinilactibacillus sp. XAAS-LB27]|uniref:DUF6339 family protein n=1 Tax=Marinilactibacillus sp. XAAS-LB27 TaxID=3114538 RepID=UPI002E179E11|nr:DUF6339 family protein [Marinilactibacillus sp. XAAS-LB27]
MINWPKYGVEKASKDFENLDIKNIIKPELNNGFKMIREKLLNLRDDIFEEYNFDSGIKEKYTFDLNFGLGLYELLKEEFKLDNRTASEDDIWRYLSIRIIPDIVHSRWNFNSDRFYMMSRRIWLKQIWWYIHLSWQGDSESTFEVLKNNTTDTILNLVERPGLGYNIKLYREIMNQYKNYQDDDRMLLRKVLVLNTAKVKSIHPNLNQGGIKKYVENLFKVVNV